MEKEEKGNLSKRNLDLPFIHGQFSPTCSNCQPSRRNRLLLPSSGLVSITPLEGEEKKEIDRLIDDTLSLLAPYHLAPEPPLSSHISPRSPKICSSILNEFILEALADADQADWSGFEFLLLRDSPHAVCMCRQRLVLAGNGQREGGESS